MQYTLKNNQIAVTISDAGAEIVSVIKDDAQYIWHGDPAFWGRHAPVLFSYCGQSERQKHLSIRASRI